MAFMPQFAPIVVLLLLGTCGALGLSMLAALYGLIRRNRLVLKWAVAGGLVIAAVYGGLLLGASLLSGERVLVRGEQKYFCEIDCHIAYSIEDVSVTNTLGPELQARTASGKFVVVRIKTWFDEKTISPHRGDSPLTPNPRRIILADERAREYQPWPENKTLELQGRGGVASSSLDTALRPGEFYFTTLVFDVPVDVRHLRLLVTDQWRVPHMLIGHEESPLHKKIWFDVGPAT